MHPVRMGQYGPSYGNVVFEKHVAKVGNWQQNADREALTATGADVKGGEYDQQRPNEKNLCPVEPDDRPQIELDFIVPIFTQCGAPLKPS
mmetsp:Transcript_17889/g.33911  ORF Transcript_17889/g.33911 Transcript_17889/m.33911 type:complete len:90 (-) Transcript_17889:222-491(-)